MATLGILNPTRFTSLIEGYSTTVTAAGTTTLSATSNYNQFFTGATTQTVRLPLTTTLVNGAQYNIVNQSSDTVTVQTNSGSAITTVTTNTGQISTCVNNGVDAPTSWSFVATSVSLTLAGDVTGPSATNTVDFIQSVKIAATSGGPTSRISFGNTTVNTSNACIGIGDSTFPSSVADTSNSVGIGRLAGLYSESNASCVGYQSGYRLETLTTCVGCLNGANSSVNTIGSSDAFGCLSMFPHTEQVQSFKRCYAFGSETLNVLGGSDFVSDENNTFGYRNFESRGLYPGSGNVGMGYETMKYNYDSDYSTALGHQAHFVPLGTRTVSVMTQSASTVIVAVAGQPTITPQMAGHVLRLSTQGYTGDRIINGITSTTQFSVASGSNFVSQNAYPLFPTSNNVAIGYQSLQNVLSQYNVAVGANALNALTLPVYSTGTVDVSNGSTAVVGVNTNWNVNSDLTSAYLVVGSTYPYVVAAIASINSPTSITLLSNYTGITATGASYYLSLGGYAPGNIGIGKNAGSAITSGTGNILIGGYTGSAAPVSATGHDNIVLSDPSGQQKFIMAPHTSRVYNKPFTVTTTNHTQTFLDSSLIFTSLDSTIDLLPADVYPGQTLIIKTLATGGLTSNATDVYALGLPTLGSTIVSGGAGKWAMLQSDGTNWRVMMSN